MIKSITIKNFQSHKETNISLHPNVNVFIGQSDSGKTAILRALLWVITNRPSGDVFRSSWGGDTSVVVDLPDGYRIRREKTNKDNKYVTYHDGSGDLKTATAETFKAMGMGVPEMVTNILNMHELNIQQQMDAPFLLSKTPGEVAAYLNDIAGLDAIDRATTNINSKIKSIASNIRIEEARKAEVDAEYTALDYINELEKKVLVLEDAEKRIVALRTEHTAIDDVLFDINELQIKITDAMKITKAKKPIDDMLQMIDQRDKLEKERDGISNVLNLILSDKHLLQSKADELKQLHKWWEENAPEVCPLCVGSGRLK